MLGAAHPGRLVPHTHGEENAAVTSVDALRAREDREGRPRAEKSARDDVPPLRRDLARARRAAAASTPTKKARHARGGRRLRGRGAPLLPARVPKRPPPPAPAQPRKLLDAKPRKRKKTDKKPK